MSTQLAITGIIQLPKEPDTNTSMKDTEANDTNTRISQGL
jgi:hypothetical protein